MTAIVDYGLGNLFSLSSSLKSLGAECEISSDPEKILAADRVILPGVGAFADAMEKLRRDGLDETVKEVARCGTPILGICLGHQLLFERSFEYGECEGLGLLKGEVRPLAEDVTGLKIPQMGWNALEFEKPDCPLFKHIKEGDFVYFVHSYAAKNCDESLAATCDYGAKVTAAVWKGNVFGTQFHPEKSGPVGLAILKAFTEI